MANTEENHMDCLQESKNVLLKLIRCKDDSSSIKSTETTYEIGINSDTVITQHQLYNLFNSTLKSGQNIGELEVLFSLRR